MTKPSNTLKLGDRELVKLRTKSIKVSTGSDTHINILSAVMQLMIKTASIKSLREQPSLTELRKIIDPAYEVIAVAINQLFPAGVGIQPQDLSGIDLDLHPTLGSYHIRVTHRGSSTIQRYVIKIGAPDGMTLFTRRLRAPVREAGTDSMTNAMEENFRL